VTEIAYDNTSEGTEYGTSDVISTFKSWSKDVYRYDSNQQLLGWDRYEGATKVGEYTSEGNLIVSKDADGKVTSYQVPTYQASITVDSSGGGFPRVIAGPLKPIFGPVTNVGGQAFAPKSELINPYLANTLEQMIDSLLGLLGVTR